jgi:hypothetical protein
VLGPVLDYINNHPNKSELVKILTNEMNESKGKCFQGVLSRLISVLSGYHEGVSINISNNEQIGNIVIMLKRNEPFLSIDQFIKLFRSELEERSYDKATIDEWVNHVEENY